MMKRKLDDAHEPNCKALLNCPICSVGVDDDIYKFDVFRFVWPIVAQKYGSVSFCSPDCMYHFLRQIVPNTRPDLLARANRLLCQRYSIAHSELS